MRDRQFQRRFGASLGGIDVDDTLEIADQTEIWQAAGVNPGFLPRDFLSLPFFPAALTVSAALSPLQCSWIVG